MSALANNSAQQYKNMILTRRDSLSNRESYAFPRPVEFHEHEDDYQLGWSWNRTKQWYLSIPEDTVWNVQLCFFALLAIIMVPIHDQYQNAIPLLDFFYNLDFAFMVFAISYSTYANREYTKVNLPMKLSFLIDIISYMHYVVKVNSQGQLKLICYYMRLHRPYRYLFALNDFNLTGSVVATTLKYCYLTLVLRVTWALVWTHMDEIEKQYIIMHGNDTEQRRAIKDVEKNYYSTLVGPESGSHWQGQNYSLDMEATRFLIALYVINKMFIPIGPSVELSNDVERIACLCVMLTGCLIVTGAAAASLSLVIGIYMRPEEAFRSRYRLIIKEMKDSHIQPSLREKVETFYKMYWQKQRAVSATKLLPTFPPTLPNSIYTDIYFEATQKSRILRDLSYPFLSEIAKKMATIHYIPGDTIIKRSSTRSSNIYITYGDIEMLTAEDDSSPILRMSRGTVLSPCGGCAPVACGRAHVQFRAGTFCTGHVLTAADLWRTVLRHGKSNGDAEMILASFYKHIERVKRHYNTRVPEGAKYKSSILHFKRNLMALKEAKDANGNLLLNRTDVFLEIAGAYIMRNLQVILIFLRLIQRADASLTDESDAICLRSTFPCILQPSSSLLDCWNYFVASFIFAVCLVHPYYLVYKKNVTLEFKFFDFMATVIYVLDLMVYLSTGANVEEGVPITFAQTSSQQMRSHWFVLDVVATAPIFEFVGNGQFAGINKILRLPKVFRVLKSLEETCVYHSNIIRFLSYTLILLIACYLIAALQQHFMCYQLGNCLVYNFTHAPHWENKPLDEETVQNRLLFGLFWAMSMLTFTTHMETGTTASWGVVYYTMFVLEICIVLHCFVEAVYSATIMVTTALREDYDSCIGDVKTFFLRTNMDPIIQQRFLTYLDLCWHTDKAYTITNKRNSIFYDLPPHVYQDILTKQRSKYVLCIPFMKYLHKEVLKDLSSKARMFYTSPNEILVNAGDIINEIYVVIQGFCEISCPDIDGRVVNTLGAKNSLGVIECLLRIPSLCTIKACTHVQILSISRKHLLSCVSKSPQIMECIKYAKELPEFHRLKQRRQSTVCYEPPVPPPNVEKFLLPKKHQPDYEFIQPFMKLGFLAILRYVFPRFTIRPDGSYLVRYEWFRAVCALLSALIYPGYAYLSLQWPVLILITLLLDVSAYYDIFQRMLVGYFNERGILMYHPSNTAAHYLKGTFIVDLFACLPLELLETARIEDIGNKYCITPTKQLLMLNRILQLYRLPNAMTLTKYIDRRDVVLLVKALPIFMVLLSVLTCVLVFNSVNIYVSADHEWLIIPFDDRGGSWINLFDDAFRFNVTETPWNLHLAVYFWIVYSTTNTGYNNLRPTNFKIMNVLFCGLVIGAMMTTYFSVRIISIRANVNTALATYQEHLKDIMVFMEREKLDKKLQKAVLDYYEYNWQKMSGIDYRNVLKLCDQISLRTDVTLNLYGSIFKKCPILLDCDVSILRMIGRAVHSLYFLQDTVIVDKSDVISDVYFLDYGNLEVREVISQDQSTVAKLTMGSLFGNLYGNPTDRCPVSLVATNKVHLLQINAQVFQNIVSDFPSVQERIRHSCSNNEKYIRGEKNECHVKPERRLSSPILARSREGLAKYLNNRSLMMQFYFIVVSIMCVYADVYNAGFQDNSPAFIVVLYVLDFGFYLKVLLNYALPHLVVEENLKIMKIAERKLYFRGEFKFDIVSCLPVEMLSFTRDGINWMLFSWLRLNRMLRIVTVSKNLNRHQTDLTYDLMMTTVVSVTIWFTLFIHCITCLWYFIGINEDEKAPRQSWLYKDDGTDRCSNVYVCSLYFILTTFMQNGIGDIMPKLHTEVMFVSLFQVISTMVYMVYVGEFSNLIHFKSFRLFSYYYKYLELQDFLQNNRVSKNLVSYVNKYCLHFWREKRGEQVPHFLKAAPHCLKQRVMSAAFMYHLTNHPIFRHCEPELLRHLVVCFELYTYTEDMFVVKEYEITDSMYFIHTGRVEETSEDPEERAMIYTAGQSFGELQGLFRDTPYKHSYRTTIKSQVLTLHLTNWEYLLIHFPKSSNAINTNFENPEEGTHSQRLKHRRATLKEDNFSANLPSNKPQVINAGSSYTSPIDQEKSVTEDVEDSTLPIKEFTSATSSDQQDCRTEMTPLFLGRSHSSVSFKNVKAGERDKQSGVAMKTEITGESKRNASDTRKVSSLFMDIISKTAKKLSRRYSSTTQLSSGVSAKDILLFQEDEATTTAIIEKLEEAQRERKAKIAMKKSISINDDEEIKEEYMETVDMTLGTSHDSKGSEEIIPMTQMSGRSVEEYLSKEHKRNKALARYKANKYLISKGVRQKLKNRLARVHYTEDRDEASTSHGKKHDVTFPNESDEEKTLAVEVMVENSAQSATKVEDALDAVSIKPEVKGSSSQAYSSQGIKSVNSNDNELLPGSDEAMNDSIQTQSSNSLVRIRLSKSIHKK